MSTESLGSIFLNAAIINNFVLALFMGICPFLGVSGKLRTASFMGAATLFVMLICAQCAWAINLALAWLGLESLRLIAFITVIASAVQLVEMLIRRFSPALFESLGIFLPLITTNCAVLGVALLNVQEAHSFLQTLLYGFGSAVGFTLVLVIFAGLRERLALAQVPAAFGGLPIAFIVAGLLSLAFMGFAGLASQ